MSSTLEQITRQTADLTRAEREQLIQYLLSTLGSQNETLKQAWQEEIARRVLSYEHGQAKLHDFEDVQKDARALLK